ncbi:SDR family NAD(P)-dependent oxidoreductase [Roseiflexus sp.]|uniref:SDR family NAD(P)-dependent oxidoreductase n=1 Tax=Roseiflexus sp. TaxID=2562120 RepID=UPI00398A9A54
MDLGLRNRVALVTGASSGIGAATARLLAEEGADVVIAFGRDETGARQTMAAVESAGRCAWLCRFDIADAAAVAVAISSICAQTGGLDVLVLCAGHNIVTPLIDITPEEWSTIIGVNLNGSFYTLRAAIPFLRDGAAVVTVASVAATTGAPHHAHYAAAKAGLVNLTKSAARALAPRVRVNCVAPGIALTPMGRDTVASLPPDYAQTKLALQRYAEPDEIARCIVFLASPAASFVTGATLDVNGGREMR